MRSIKTYKEHSESVNEGFKDKILQIYDKIRDRKYNIVTIFKILSKSWPDIFGDELKSRYDLKTQEGKDDYLKELKDRMNIYFQERADTPKL